MEDGRGLQAEGGAPGALETNGFAAYIKDMAENPKAPVVTPIAPVPDTGSPKPPTGADQARPVSPEPEFGGPPGPEPTRYGDWERGGRCIDF
jgi:hypothetical protein